MADLDFPELGLLVFGPADLVFEDLVLEALSFEDLDFGIAAVSLGAVARFAAFRPRLAMFPPLEP